MNRRNRTQLGLGIVLILAAAWMIASRLVPDLNNMFAQTFTWPMWIILAGALILLIGLLVGSPGMASRPASWQESAVFCTTTT